MCVQTGNPGIHTANVPLTGAMGGEKTAYIRQLIYSHCSMMRWMRWGTQ